jgi:hypothetical protein
MTKTFRLLPRAVLFEIDAVLRLHQGKTLQVYAEAEAIRQRHQELNIALEDILTHLVEDSGKYQVAVAFDPDEAVNALMYAETQQSRAMH